MRGIIVGLTMGIISIGVNAQCPDVYDYLGNLSDSPEWYACSGNDYTLNFQTDEAVGNWSIDWGDGSPMESGTSLAANTIVSHTYTLTINEFTVTFNDLDDGCSVIGTLVMEEATSASIQIPIGGLTSACAPQNLEFINSSTNTSPNTVFTWDFGDGSANEVYDYTNLGQTITHTYQQETVDCQTVVTLTAENLCNVVQGGPSNATFDPIRIWDLDVASIDVTPTTVCTASNTFTFTNSSDINCFNQGNNDQRYEYWNFGDYWGLGTDSIVDWLPIYPNDPPSYTLSFPSVGSFTVMMIDSNFCGADTAYATVNVVDPPTAGIIANPTSVCEGEIINFSNTSDPADYQVNFDDGNGFNVIGPGNFTHSYNFAGIYDVELIAYIDGSITTCSDTTQITITVNPGPNADFTIPQNSSCGPLSLNFTNITTGAISWDWDFGNTNTSSSPTPPIQNYTTVGTYPVSLIAEAPNGCTSTKLDTIHIYDPPVADFSFTAQCDGDSVIFSDQSTANVIDPITGYSWDFDDTFTSSNQNPNHTFASAGSYDVSLTVTTANCNNEIIIPVDVADGSLANFTPSVVSGCTPLTVAFNNTSTNADTYNWNFGDGNFTTIVSPSHDFINTGTNTQTFTVSLYTNNAMGCADTIQQTITVYPLPQANFSMQTGAACAPVDVDFLNLSNGASTYEWDFEPGQTSSLISPSYLYINNGTTPITFNPQLVAITNFGCTDTTSQDVTVYPEPSYSFDLSVFSGCSPLPVTMPVVDDAVSYNWDFGNGNTSVLAQPTQIYVNNGVDTLNFSVELIASNSFGCSDTATSVITVYPNAISQFTPNQYSGCSPLNIEFNDNSVIADSYLWNFGDSDTSSTVGDVSHIFENVGNAPVDYTTTLEVTSEHGCQSTSSVNITVFPQVTASFTSDSLGCTPLTIDFTNTSTAANSYYWSFGDGNVEIGTNPIHEYINPGQDNLDLQAYLISTSNFGCKDTAYQDITVYPQAIANFQTDVVQGCSPLELELINTLTPGSVYNWNYGNGNVSLNGEESHTQTFINLTDNPIVYTILLETTTDYGCTATTQKEITVFPELNADFQVDDSFCSGTDVIFTNTSTGAVQYTWQFGDGNESNDTNPIYAYTNITGSTQTIPVLLTAESVYGCTDSKFNLVNVFSAPIAAFNIDSSTVCYPLYLELANNSQHATSYNWSYGDGGNSTTDALLHNYTYTNDGQTLLTNTIELIATTENGCVDITSQDVQVIPELIADFAPIDDACHPLPVTFDNNSIGALEYQWTLDIDEITDEIEPSYTYVNYGIADEIFEVTLVVSSYFGCTDTLTREIIVHPIPDAEFTVTPTLQTYPDATIDILDNSVYGSSTFTWDMGDGFVSDTMITSYTYGTYGTYFVILTIDNGFCSDQITQRVDIIPPPPTSLFLGEGEGCTDLSVEFVNLSEYAEEYIWNFGDGETSTEENPTHIYTIPGDYTVSLLVTGIGGNDVSIQEDIVHAYPHAEADFNVNPPLAQTGDEVFFYNISQNAGIYEWDFGNGITSTESNPTMIYDQPGFYDVTLIANNEFNCPDSLFMAGALEVEIGGFVSFPNAFTPNPNGQGEENYDPESLNNDIFHPVFAGVLEYNLQIYNRWGELLFETYDINKGWNGFYNGKLVPLGVYVWRADVLFTDQKQFVKSGDITLLR